MAKTSYIIIPEGLDDQVYRNLQSGNRFQYARLRLKTRFFSRARLKNITQRSLLPYLSDQWSSLTDEQRLAWSDAGAVSGYTGWRLFVSDTTWRTKLDIGGLAVPSEYHQSLTGKIVLYSDADYLLISQIHPQTYWVQKKVTGTKNTYEPVLVRENFTLPLSIGISYRSDLTVTTGDPVARFFADVKSLYQGRTISNIVEIPFDLVSDWTSSMDQISSVIGRAIGYTLYMEFRNVSGTFEFDNVRAVHSSENWARDPRCNAVSTSFTRAYFQVPKNWGIIEIAEGVFFRTDYPED